MTPGNRLRTTILECLLLGYVFHKTSLIATIKVHFPRSPGHKSKTFTTSQRGPFIKFPVRHSACYLRTTSEFPLLSQVLAASFQSQVSVISKKFPVSLASLFSEISLDLTLMLHFQDRLLVACSPLSQHLPIIQLQSLPTISDNASATHQSLVPIVGLDPFSIVISQHPRLG